MKLLHRDIALVRSCPGRIRLYVTALRKADYPVIRVRLFQQQHNKKKLRRRVGGRQTTAPTRRPRLAEIRSASAPPSTTLSTARARRAPPRLAPSAPQAASAATARAKVS